MSGGLLGSPWVRSGLAALGLGAAALGGLAAMDWRAELAAETEDLLFERERLTHSLARIAEERAALDGALGSDLAWRAPGAGEATARVQSELSRAAAAAGVSIRTMTPIGEREVPLTGAVALRLEGEGALAAWRTFLVTVEHAAPPLRVERAALRRVVRAGGAADTFLAAQIDVLAPYLPPEDDT